MNQTLDEKILEQIRQYIDEQYSVLFGITAKDVKSSAIDLRYELGLDSQDMVFMLADFEKKYQLDIPDDKAVTIRTVGDVIDLIKRMSSLDWIRNGQAQPAKETVAPKAAEPVQKAASQKPSAMVLFFMTRGGKKLPRKTPRKPADKFVMPQKPMMFNPGKKR